ncbi:transcriptional formate dehydrogenase alpha major subunit [Mannheimia haemolytica serotype A2 str. OVINE]|nr:transcriptional formate dehydrogenase alpha major subunit [Mannheimia haemolytica serotype A2 str. OVINE]EEY12216.1 transcriptional formate dehydrogenase alpha major subunit [Mannheimia haemolytica serotype A2 str. BOVINE]EPY99404.1 sulfate ABC transporter substrate-binding protein [Mannheimia haemolytica D35]EPZ01015.1 sulfate ABC transporter substrate-binding protein [Mannheimia haemolytica D38]
MAGTSAAMLGFAPATALAAPREYKLLRAKETRQTCTYCAVGCGMIMYSLGGEAMNSKGKLIHIEGDSDHPVSRGALCPKGAGALDYVNSDRRVHYPEVREAGSSEWKRISWHEAIERIARHMKNDRDENFVTHNEAGLEVNRWMTAGFLAGSACSNETGIVTQKFIRSLGMIFTDNQASI